MIEESKITDNDNANIGFDENAQENNSFSVSSSTSSPVVIAKGNSKVPILLIIVFNIVLAIFVYVTYILVQTIMEKQKEQDFVSTEVLPIRSPKNTPTEVPVISNTAKQKPDVIAELKKTSTSDGLSDIAKDIEETNLSAIDEVINSLDQEFEYIVPTPFQ